MLGALLILLALLPVQPVLAAETGPLKPDFSGYPLAYERVMNYDLPYPDVEALYVNRLWEGTPAVEAGLRRGSMIESIAGTPVRTLEDVRGVLGRHAGETVTFVVHTTSARYRKRARENPLLRPRSGDIYERRELRAFYRHPRPERLTVVAGPNRRLYHRVTLRHSPDTSRHTTYPNRQEAHAENLRACPICFPGREESILEKVVENELAASEQIITRLLEQHSTVAALPEELQSVFADLSPHRLHTSITPRLIVLETPQPYALSLPSGKIVLSQGFLNLAETRSELGYVVARLLAHVDLHHNPNPVQTSRVRRLVEEAIRRTTGVGFTFEQIKGWAPKLPGFSYYRDILSQGYSEDQERRASFLGIVYLSRAGYSLKGVDRWLEKMHDLEDAVHPHWLNFLLRHPLPGGIDQDVREWKRRIPKKLPPGSVPSVTGDTTS